MPLTPRQIQYGFYYFFKNDPRPKSVVELLEYAGERELCINCTQLDASYQSAKDRKRVPAEWIEFLTQNPRAFTRLRFGTRMSQEMFDAVCQQVNLVDLEIKWGGYQDLAQLANLQKLELLSIGTGAGVLSIRPIAGLTRLKGLNVENFQKIHDYSDLAALSKLESLTIAGDCFGPRYIKVDSLGFLRQMKQLRFFCFETARLLDGDYTPILDLKKLEHLSLERRKEMKPLFPKLSALPKLKWGTIKEQPELYV